MATQCSLVDQLCMANQSEGGRPIVVLAEMEKDKKSAGNHLHLIVPRTIGRCEVQFIDKEQLKAFR